MEGAVKEWTSTTGSRDRVKIGVGRVGGVDYVRWRKSIRRVVKEKEEEEEEEEEG